MEAVTAPRLPKTLMIGCGAVANEMVAIIKANGWDHVTLTCLPAEWHNTPDKIPEGMARKINEAKEDGSYERIVSLYADCGTGGMLDVLLEKEGVVRIPGPHCYEFFSTQPVFEQMMEEELGSLFLTDFFVRHFDRLILDGLGISKHPELRDMYFGHYKRAIYMAQAKDSELEAMAKACADKIGLKYEYIYTGYGTLETYMTEQAGA